MPLSPGVTLTPVFVPDRVLAAEPWVVGVWVLAATGATRDAIIDRAMERGASRNLCEHEVERALAASGLHLEEEDPRDAPIVAARAAAGALVRASRRISEGGDESADAVRRVALGFLSDES